MADAFINDLRHHNWKSIPLAGMTNTTVPSRYKSIPDELIQFISSYGVLSNHNETQWLLSIVDYTKERFEGFRWNEFELISIQAAEEDEEWKEQIRSFWDAHLPIYMSVEGAYSYAAYCCSGKNAGDYVYGNEPEFEEVSVVAHTLAEFKEWLLNEAIT
jgi:hypothetical protein